LGEKTEEVSEETEAGIHEMFSNKIKEIFNDEFINCSSKRLHRAFMVLAIDTIFDP